MSNSAEPASLGASTVSIHVVRGLMEAIASIGRDPAALLRAASFDAARLHAPEARIPRAEMDRLCELAIEISGDPAFGLHWAERLSKSAFAPVPHLLAHATNLRHSFASLAQFHRLLADDLSYALVEEGDRVTLRVDDDPRRSEALRRLVAEMLVAGLNGWVRLFGPREAVAYHFAYPAPSYAREYVRMFGSPQFDSAFTGLVFSRALLDAPAPHRDDDVHDALSALAERRLSRIHANTPYALRVRDFLVRDGWKEDASMDAAARALSLSVRSLRRRLSEEGTSYFLVANDALAVVAKQLLRDERRTIQEVAYEMKFSDASSFHRAFKRWTGMTPNAFRSEK